MPSKSPEQHRLMEAVAHNPGFAKKAGIPQSVGQDFSEADKGRKFSKGGNMVSKAHEEAEMKFMKAKGAPKKMVEEEKKEREEMGMKRGGHAKKFAKGGGIESRGKTVGKMVTMKRGGKCG